MSGDANLTRSLLPDHESGEEKTNRFLFALEVFCGVFPQIIQ
jgi:hypothetical protein